MKYFTKIATSRAAARKALKYINQVGGKLERSSKSTGMYGTKTINIQKNAPNPITSLLHETGHLMDRENIVKEIKAGMNQMMALTNPKKYNKALLNREFQANQHAVNMIYSAEKPGQAAKKIEQYKKINRPSVATYKINFTSNSPEINEILMKPRNKKLVKKIEQLQERKDAIAPNQNVKVTNKILKRDPEIKKLIQQKSRENKELLQSTAKQVR